MAAIGLSAEAADARLKKEGLGNTVVGCDNSAVNVTLAGKPSLACTQLPGAAHGASMRAFLCAPNDSSVNIVLTTLAKHSVV